MIILRRLISYDSTVFQRSDRETGPPRLDVVFLPLSRLRNIENVCGPLPTARKVSAARGPRVLQVDPRHTPALNLSRRWSIYSSLSLSVSLTRSLPLSLYFSILSV